MIVERNFNPTTYTHSDKADQLKIDNTQMTDEQQENLLRLHELMVHIQGRLSIKFARPVQIQINSGFRSEALNKAVGGVATSQHSKGEAVDTVAVGVPIEDYFKLMKELVNNKVIEVDQCIQERDAWLHISLKKEGNRNQFLRMKIINGKTQYIKEPL